MLIHQPSYVVLPVVFKEPWYDDPGIQVLQFVNHALNCPKWFVAALILRITALITLISSFALSATALVQKIHTANHVDTLSKNVSVALYLQKQINKKIKAWLNVLKKNPAVCKKPSPKFKNSLNHQISQPV